LLEAVAFAKDKEHHMKISLTELEVVTNQSGLTIRDTSEIQKMLDIAAKKNLISPRPHNWLIDRFHKDIIIALKHKRVVASVVLTEVTKSKAILEAAVWRGGHEVGSLLREKALYLAKKKYLYIYSSIFKSNIASLEVWSATGDFNLIDESTVDKGVLFALLSLSSNKEQRCFLVCCAATYLTHQADVTL